MEIKEKNVNSLKEKSLHNLTTDVELENVVPAKGRVLVSIKVWPAQSVGGVFVPDSYTVVRNNKYIVEVLAVGEGVTFIKKGYAATISAFAGYHVATKTGHAKIVCDTDILSYKKTLDMKNANAFKPDTFIPGINYMLVKVKNVKENVTAGGIVVSTSVQQSRNDAITRTAEVKKVGERNDYGKQFTAPKIGSVVILDNFVGDRVNDTTADPEYDYFVVYIFDVLGYIK